MTWMNYHTSLGYWVIKSLITEKIINWEQKIGSKVCGKSKKICAFFKPKFASAGVSTDNPTLKIEVYVNGETYPCWLNVLSYTLRFLKIKKTYD